jgi:hypothetical protein
MFTYFDIFYILLGLIHYSAHHHSDHAEQHDQAQQVGLGQGEVHQYWFQDLAAAATVSKPEGSSTAIWASILRLIRTSAFFRPPIKRL